MATFGKVGKRAEMQQLALFDESSEKAAPKSEHAAFGHEAPEMRTPRQARQLTYAEQIAASACREYDAAHVAWCDAQNAGDKAQLTALWQARNDAWRKAAKLCAAV